MAITKERKAEVVSKFKRADLDTGSSEVQIALLTERIVHLTEHFKIHKQDHHGRRGLVTLVNRRRKLLTYMKGTKPDTYKSLLADLGLRK